MKRTLALCLAAGSLLLGIASASPALAKAKPAPIQLLCSTSANGGTLVNGTCVLPGAIAGGTNDYFGIIAVSNPNAGDTFQVVSGTVPPGLTVLPQYGSGTIVTGIATTPGTFVFTIMATSQQGATATLAYSITVTAQPADTLVCSPATNGGTLVNGVCVLPGASVGQASSPAITPAAPSPSLPAHSRPACPCPPATGRPGRSWPEHPPSRGPSPSR